MATKKTKPTDTELVAAYMDGLDHKFKNEINALREIISHANPKIRERIKWNAPSYYYVEDMAAFNPRAEGFVQIIFVFPKGLVADDSGLLEGEWKDRRMAKFYDLADIKSKKKALEKVVNAWVDLIDQ